MSNGKDVSDRIASALHEQLGGGRGGARGTIREGLEAAYPVPAPGEGTTLLSLLQIATVLRDMERRLEACESRHEKTTSRCEKIEEHVKTVLQTREDRDKAVLMRIITFLIGLLMTIGIGYVTIVTDSLL